MLVNLPHPNRDISSQRNVHWGAWGPVSATQECLLQHPNDMSPRKSNMAVGFPKNHGNVQTVEDRRALYLL